MYVRHLSLVDFRGYAAAELALRPGVTTLLGLNGQGKTNLVEAVGYLATLGSHRVAQDAPLVRFGADRAVVRGAVVRDGREQLIELEIVPGRANRARLNRSPVGRPRDVLGVLRTVLFAPEDLGLVKGDPDQRRRFLDDLLVARQPRWAGVRADYDKIVRQRNALLKSAAADLRRAGRRNARRVGVATAASTGDPSGSGGGGKSGGDDPVRRGDASGAELGGHPDRTAAALHTLDIWDEQLATVGAQLLYARLRLLADLRPLLAAAYDEVSDSRAAATATYRSSLAEDVAAPIAAGAVPEPPELHAALLRTMAGLRAKEFERGVTLVGPHRDDVHLALGELPAKGYASHGESWSFALGLRLAAFHLLRRDLRDDPVLILDDVFAELDARRRDRLAALVADAEQVLVTAAVPADVPAQLAGATCRIDAGLILPPDPAPEPEPKPEPESESEPQPEPESEPEPGPPAAPEAGDG